MKLNADTKARLVEGIKLGMTNKLAAQYAGISEQCFYQWRDKAKAGNPEHVELFESLKRAEAQSAAHSLAVIKKAAQDGTWTAAAWMLERRHNFRREAVHEPVEVDTSELVDPNTAEGRAAIIAHVAELPDDIILAALNRGVAE
jgi:transposase-like protein